MKILPSYIYVKFIVYSDLQRLLFINLWKFLSTYNYIEIAVYIPIKINVCKSKTNVAYRYVKCGVYKSAKIVVYKSVRNVL